MDAVSLTVDYSNGAQKHFAAVPWQAGLTILGALEAAQAIAPGLAVTYGSDRSGHAMDVAIDGVPGEADRAARWAFWVNGRPGPERLGTQTSIGFHPDSRAENEVAAGDHVLAKLVEDAP